MARRTGNRAASEDLGQSLALQQLGYEIRSAVRAEIVDGHHIGMTKRRGGAGFLFEARQARGVGTERLGEDLDRHLPAKTGVAGAIHFAHPSRADERDDLIGPEARSGLHDGPVYREADRAGTAG
jgi:hypothetical protein